jgi:hypothetical protein
MTILCPKCKSDRVSKNGKYRQRQGYRCKDCNRQFIVSNRQRSHGIIELGGKLFTTKDIVECGIPPGTAKNRVFQATHGKKGCYMNLPIDMVENLSETGHFQSIVAEAISSATDDIEPIECVGDRKKMVIYLSPQLIEKMRFLMRTGRFKSRNELVVACLIQAKKDSEYLKNMLDIFLN